MTKDFRQTRFKKSLIPNGGIMSSSIILFGIFLICSCNQRTNSNNKLTGVTKQDEVEKAITDTIIKEVTDAPKTEPIEKVFNIDSCKSPAGLVIIFWGPSDIEGQYYFLDDKRVVNRYYNEFAFVGTWDFKDSLITITYNKKYFRKGIGEPIPLEGAVPGNYIEQFENYEYLSEEYTETESYHWNDIKRGIKDNSGFCELVSNDFDDKMYSDLINLQIEID